jgi:hypothetical protein
LTGPLNLADADLKGFEALEPGRYGAEIFALTMDAVKNTSGQGKLPAGTPQIKVQFKVVEPEDYDNRRVFQTYSIPPSDYDASKAAKMKGMIARFFMALGYTEEEVRNKKFDPDFEDQLGKKVLITVTRSQKMQRVDDELVPVEGEYNNNVTAVKPYEEGAVTGASSDGGLL